MNSFTFHNEKTKKDFPIIFTIEMKQDDPTKCTSAKMRKFGFARPIRKERIPRGSIVLNPSSDEILMISDRPLAITSGLVVIDCSWNLSETALSIHFRGQQRRLPSLLAGNPTNYARIGRLSSIEAVAASLYIMNFKEKAERIISLYKWGPTFLTLNHDALEDYSKASNSDQMIGLEEAYFADMNPKRS